MTQHLRVFSLERDSHCICSKQFYLNYHLVQHMTTLEINFDTQFSKPTVRKVCIIKFSNSRFFFPKNKIYLY